MFLSWFVVQKVMDRDKSNYLPVLREFVGWLGKRKAVGKVALRGLAEALDELEGEPERCEKLSCMLYEFTRRDAPTYQEWLADPESYRRKGEVLRAIHHEEPKEVLDGHLRVAKVGPGALWLESPEEGPDVEIGPVQVPKKAAELARVGDEISCAVGKMKDFWKLLEAGGVYPG